MDSKKPKFATTFLFLYVVFILVMSIIKQNTSFLIVGILMAVFFALGMWVTNKRKAEYTMVFEQYHTLLEEKKYDELIQVLSAFKPKYFIQVLISNVILYKGDETEYLKHYNQLKDQGNRKGFYYGWLHHLHMYYRILKENEIKMFVQHDSRYPYGTIISAMTYEDYKFAQTKIKTLAEPSSSFMEYFKAYLEYIVNLKLGEPTEQQEQILHNLSNENEIIKEHYDKLNLNYPSI